MTRRARGTLVCAALLAAAALAAGEDESAATFQLPFTTGGGSLQRVCAGPGGTVFVAGYTRAPDLPGTTDPRSAAWPEMYDFVTALDARGAVLWTSYVRDRDDSYDLPGVRSVEADAEGGAWIAGTGRIGPRDGGPVDPPDGPYDRDAWVARFAPDGALLWFVNFGGTAEENVRGFALTADGGAVLVGSTVSTDLPASGSQQSERPGDADGFVARFRGDGSIAWSSYLGGPGHDEATAVAEDASGDLLVSKWEWVGDRYSGASETHADLVRLSSDGAPEDSFRLPGGRSTVASAIAVLPDGRVYVGGWTSYGSYGPGDGFVVRVTPGAPAAEILWREQYASIDRLAPSPDGGVVAREAAGTVLRIDPAGAVRWVVSSRESLRAGDLDVAEDGACCLVGYGRNVLSHPAAGSGSFTGEFVARVPVSGVEPPSNIRIRSARASSADLVWSRDADPVAGYEVERFDYADYGWDRTLQRVAEVPGTARRVHVSGLAPGTSHGLRLVIRFASGFPRGFEIGGVITRPVAPPAAVAGTIGDRVRVSWAPGGNGEGTTYQVERSVGGGPFVRLRRVFGSRPWHTDFVTAWDAPVTYRVRAVTPPHRPSAWTYAPPVVPRSPFAAPFGESTSPGPTAGPRPRGARDLVIFDTDR